MDIIIDPKFRDKIPRPTEEEYRQLEENILTFGRIRDPLVVWSGRNILLDGHSRWSIYQAHSDVLPYPTVLEMDFKDEYEAEDWMLFNQLGRRNLNEFQTAALRGQLYKTMKKAVGNTKSSRNTDGTFQCTQNGNNGDHPARVSEQMANRLGIGKNTVIRDEQFLDGLEAADAVVPGFKEEILSLETKANKQDIAALRKVTPEKMPEAVEQIRSPKKVTFPSSNVNMGPSKSKLIEEVERQSAMETTTKAKVKYTLDDLIEELTLIQQDFFDKYYTVLDIHRDIATDTAKARKAVSALMKEFLKEFEEVKEIVA